MFYNRPNLPALGLDLAELEGGGSCPSQFWGRCVDDRPIFIHYRNGWLTIYSGPRGSNPRASKDVILEANIGWPLHGVILKEQACDLAGITIRGERPSLSDEALCAARERNDVRDWSGRTTYWVRDVLITEDGGRKLAQELAIAVPDMRMLEVDWIWGPARRIYVPRKAISDCRSSVVFGAGAAEHQLAKMLMRDHVTLALFDEVFAWHLTFQFEWNGIFGRRRFEAGLTDKYGRDIACRNVRSLHGRLSTKFSTHDAEQEAAVRRVIAVVQSCFAQWVEDVDLATGMSVGRPRQINWYSLDLRDWGLAAPDRYLSYRTEKEGSGRDIGMRPCHAPV